MLLSKRDAMAPHRRLPASQRTPTTWGSDDQGTGNLHNPQGANARTARRGETTEVNPAPWPAPLPGGIEIALSQDRDMGWQV